MSVCRSALAALLLAAIGGSCGVAGMPAASALAQLDPTVLGGAVDAVVQLSIVVEGTVDGEDQLIWYAVGSGSVVDERGLILTNQHLISPPDVDEALQDLESQLAAEGKQADLHVNADRFMVGISDGRHLPLPRYTATMAAQDEALDLAVLRIESDERGNPLDIASLSLPALALGDSDAVNLGDPIHVFGFPAIGSGSLTYTHGVVSGFLFQEGIDGTAWINTDAVTSGGNSGGAAVNSGGELIGVPTSGSALDCRPGDTNHDGAVGPEDFGCVPTGGSLTQLRPIALAQPLLSSVGVPVAATEAGDPETDPVVAEPGDASDLAAAQGCAERGDWRCAVNFYRLALAGGGDSAVVGALYDAYLALGEQEMVAGRLDSARSAFDGAAAADPARPEAPAALERLAPYRRAILVDTFEGAERFTAEVSDGSASQYVDGGSEIAITEPGLISGYPLTDETRPLQGSNFAARLEIGDVTGDGMVTIETRTDPNGGIWAIAVDPTRQTWEVLQFERAEDQFLPWGGPYSYGGGATGSGLQSVELRVRDGIPTLLVNGTDVGSVAGASLPQVGNRGTVSFGAVMNSEGTQPFSVNFDEIGLFELN